MVLSYTGNFHFSPIFGQKGLLMLFSPSSLGGLNLPNRIIMPPTTHSRAQREGMLPLVINVMHAQGDCIFTRV
ncbi:hypothetical protein GHA01_07780 [Novacetimonas hansenii]|uniref:Uncharacterized protein n=2 Tax=Novacetimonas hansenii TaxID=436 RepID=A0ABQ0SCM1_NOVHA|nr:hypothetical protein Gaha_0187_010 [Novacetimonas hansenii JCM 7643]GEC62929.1 hypothetical protein GHA01_07780 [Novacetimonas hansenii]